MECLFYGGLWRERAEGAREWGWVKLGESIHDRPCRRFRVGCQPEGGGCARRFTARRMCYSALRRPTGLQRILTDAVGFGK